MIVLGVLLLIIGLLAPALSAALAPLHVLFIIGLVLLLIGLVLYALGAVGRPVGGRRHYF